MQALQRELILEASRGDVAAFEKIYRETADYVYGLAARITGNRADAEEVAQDVYLTIHRELGNFRFEASFTTWLYRITVNRAISAARKAARRRARQVEYDEGIDAGDRCNAPQEAVGREERIRSLLEVLNPDQRACIILREIEGMRYAEIAEALGVRINTVRSRLRRARGIIASRAREGGETT